MNCRVPSSPQMETMGSRKQPWHHTPGWVQFKMVCMDVTNERHYFPPVTNQSDFFHWHLKGMGMLYFTMNSQIR